MSVFRHDDYVRHGRRHDARTAGDHDEDPVDRWMAMIAVLSVPFLMVGALWFVWQRLS